MLRTIRLLLPLLVLLIPMNAAAQSRPVTPRPGSTERAAILNVLRAPVQKELKQTVAFTVEHLKVLDGWAFLRGIPRRPGGKPVDYRKTRYAEAMRMGIFDDGICALLRKKGGKWRVVVYDIGATDVVYADWDRKYRAPSAIFR